MFPISTECIQVSCAIIFHQDLFLIAQRHHHSNYEPDKWEFPGGKIEEGETPEKCLMREIKEELGITIGKLQPFMNHQHTYQKKDHHRTVLLHTFLAIWMGGELQKLDCQDIRWVHLKDLDEYPFVAGDYPILEKLKKEYTSQKFKNAMDD